MKSNLFKSMDKKQLELLSGTIGDQSKKLWQKHEDGTVSIRFSPESWKLIMFALEDSSKRAVAKSADIADYLQGFSNLIHNVLHICKLW